MGLAAVGNNRLVGAGARGVGKLAGVSGDVFSESIDQESTSSTAAIYFFLLSSLIFC